ncbi:flagellar secreted protein [Campylobacter pinnipediorum subsp. caledonicus]|uniref:flagellin n=1 Tax=Campylobacter pinnipediorum TaxID=1965231 RepID=UPI00099579A5|nr:flagellin [Campylobacter pinnipediorum]AQW86291.1 flagellar secreted protein [Campylobacter pinnipediorum subsp. caledonicus]
MKVNNISSTQYLNSADKAKQAQDKALQNISANRALSGVDSANLAIADSLLSQANVINQGIANANDAIGALNIADSTLNNITQTADRLNELSVKSNNPALSDRERGILNREADRLKESIGQSIDNATFNGKNVFGDMSNFYTGNATQNISLSENSVRSGANNLDISNQNGINDFINDVNRLRGEIGSVQNGIVADINSSLKQNVALRQSESGLQNNDISKNLNEQNNEKLKLNASILAQSHNVANLQSQIDRLLA